MPRYLVMIAHEEGTVAGEGVAPEYSSRLFR